MPEAEAGVESQERLRADGALVVLTVLWGTTFVVVKDALSHGDPFSFLTLRFGVGAAVLSVLAGRRMFAPSTLRRGAVLGIFLFAGFALQTVGLTDTTPSRSAFITGLYVLLVPLVMLVLFRRVPRASSLVGVVLSAMGLYYLTGTDVGSAGFSRGDGLTLGCTVAYAFHIAFTDRYAPKEGVDALVAVQLWVVTLLSALCLPFAGARVEWTPAFLGAVVFCGVFASAVALSVQTWAQARTSAVRAAIIYSLEPLFAAAFSVVLGYERL
ncbi:DMT family transporter, partial [Hyalangium sp.]|uniref:DMT family transporter n=1 Tax=Hyalangium sp. TaxID=2028555 RepID=UPI002D5CB2C0